ncbi:Methyltransferase domain-containing protein [Amycolatopsis sacchari]|uniref:Methyltransferase domain-containing protein n=2 Tax=Amycolatopsis sacchari TaxID=115433 RepID=A0A1I4C8R0_9PSEU|nr:Methyltransferase domain-containing protein [Amycolatopsis sacchari]
MVAGMTWLADTRTSYDTVAVQYSDQVRNSPTENPYVRSTLALFADLVSGGPVADVGCGPGHVTAHLRKLGLDAFGIDLSPGMVDVARREYPDTRFAIGSMTDLPLADASLGGLITWWSLIHVPAEELPGVFAHFRRVLRPGGTLLVGFHEGDRINRKTQGYGGLPMNVHVHLHPVARMRTWLTAAGFAVESETVLTPADKAPAAIVFAR